jgi:homoserine dehydrogenase
MRDKGSSFATVLKKRRPRLRRGDPTFDIEGIDAAHKLTIMSAIAFGVPMQFEKVYTEGISKLTGEDIRYAEELGYRIKLLGSRGERRPESSSACTRRSSRRNGSSPTSKGVMNAVLVKGDAVGATLYYGAGAGAEPTASAVIADLVDVTRMHTADPEHRVPHLAFQPDQLADVPFLPMGDVVTSYYLRMRVADRPGVLADITRILADREISINAMIQKEPPEGEAQTDIILLTHQCIERDVVAAIAKIEALPTVKGTSSAFAWKSSTRRIRSRRCDTSRRAARGPSPSSRFRRSCSKAWRPTAASPCRTSIRVFPPRSRADCVG